LRLEEEARRLKYNTAKFIRIPLIIHVVLKKDNSFNLQVEHLEVKRTSIHIPRDAINLKHQEIEDFIKQMYPEARAFVIQYEKKGEEVVPFCAQLFLSGRPKGPQAY
jgi:hypothetical protein